MLLVTALACVHGGAAPGGGPGPTPEEVSLRTECDAGQAEACGALAVQLEGGQYGPGRSAEALAVARLGAGQNGQVARVAMLLADAHPGLVSVADRIALKERVCQTDIPMMCAEAAELARPTDPGRASELLREGCRLGEVNQCRMADGSWVAGAKPGPEFANQLDRLHVSLTVPPGFTEVPVAESRDFQTAFAVRSDDGRMEVRYGVRDMRPLLDSMAACATQPGCVSVPFEAAERSEAVVTLANVGTLPPGELQTSNFPPLPVRIEFNADWGVTGSTSSRKSWAAPGSLTLLAFLHRDPATDLYVFFIFNDRAAIDDLFPTVIHSMRFADPVGVEGLR